MDLNGAMSHSAGWNCSLIHMAVCETEVKKYIYIKHVRQTYVEVATASIAISTIQFSRTYRSLFMDMEIVASILRPHGSKTADDRTANICTRQVSVLLLLLLLFFYGFFLFFVFYWPAPHYIFTSIIINFINAQQETKNHNFLPVRFLFLLSIGTMRGHGDAASPQKIYLHSMHTIYAPFRYDN